MPVLTILDGIQAGSKTSLGVGGSLIGTGTNCTVVIADPAMRSDHFEVQVADATVLHALSELVLPDGSSLAPGSRIALTGAMAFTAGGTRFLIELPVPASLAADPAEAVPNRQVRRPAILLSGCAAALALAGGAWLTLRDTTMVAAKQAAPVALQPSRSGSADRDVAARMLRSRLAAAGLSGVSVTTQADGTLTVGGVLGVGDEAAWTEVRQWFDARFGNEFVVVERFGTPGTLPPLRVAAVWSGAHPYVVDDQGNRLHAGATFGNGWFVEGIADGHVVVRRGTQTVSLRYAP